MYEKKLKIYDEIVALCPEIERKGKTMAYTSSNGYMFSLLNKEAEIGIRLSKESQEIFKEKYDSTIFKSHGAVMRDYVLVTDAMLTDLKMVAKYLKESYAYVNSLPPKATKKKK